MDAAVPWRVRDAALLLVVGFLVLGLTLLGAVGLYHLQGAPTVLPPQPPAILATLATDLFYLTILVGVWMLVVRRYGVGWGTIGLRLPGLEALAPTLFLAAILVAGSIALLSGQIWLLGTLGLKARLTALTSVPQAGDPLFAVTLLGSLALTPIAEEVLFRGVLYQSLRNHLGTVLGAAGSALLFALAHARPGMVPEFLLLGIVLAIAFQRTRSLYPSILLHAAYNGAIVFVAWHAA